jgi:predicted small lipoprotein YifL
MKRFISLLLVLMMVFSMAACSKPAETPTTTAAPTGGDAEPTEPTEPEELFPGKIAIVTNTLSQNEEEYRSAQDMVAKYGEDKIVHVLWPDNFMTEQEQMISIISKLASDEDVKALIINQAVPGTNAAVDKLLEVRDDIFIIYATPQENPPDVAARANLILQPDELQMGVSIPEQAKKLGATTLVHYSFPRHMSVVMLAQRREIMKETCEEIGIEFVDATAPDPTGDAGVPGAQQFILEDVPKMVEKYGVDTAFFSTNCAMQTPLIKAVVDTGAIYPQPCCPSPFHGFPSALGIEASEFTQDSLQHVVAETTRILEEKGVLGRLSTWPVPVAMMYTVAGTEYAIKYLNGEVGEELDVEVLADVMSEYAGLSVVSSPYVEETADGSSVEYPTFRLVFMDYLTFGE